MTLRQLPSFTLTSLSLRPNDAIQNAAFSALLNVTPEISLHATFDAGLPAIFGAVWNIAFSASLDVTSDNSLNAITYVDLNAKFGAGINDRFGARHNATSGHGLTFTDTILKPRVTWV